MFGLRINLGCIGIFKVKCVPGKFNCRKLHTITEAEIWDLTFAGELNGGENALYCPGAKTARDYDAVKPSQNLNPFCFDLGGIDPGNSGFKVEMGCSVAN